MEQRLAHNDQRMIEEHAQQTDLALQDVGFMFSAGDQCLLRAPSGGKLKRHTIGPYMFGRYVGWQGMNAEVVGSDGGKLTVSVANLRLLDPRMHVDCYTWQAE